LVGGPGFRAFDTRRRHAEAVQTVMVDREVIGYAVSLADATRHPAENGLKEIAGMIEFGASPRGPIGLVQAARALALLRGRAHVEMQDIRDLTPDLLRHRIVLSYDALSDGVTADELIDQVLATVPEPGARRLMRTEREDRSAGGLMGA
jgi:MoxR-like ATPase